MVERDRKTVEELYISMKIQVLIATATVAWGVNFPTHLVVVKGTEFYDGKLKRYVDMPITDVVCFHFSFSFFPPNFLLFSFHFPICHFLTFNFPHSIFKYFILFYNYLGYV